MLVPPSLKRAGHWRTFQFCRSKFKQIELWREADEAGQPKLSMDTHAQQ